MRNRYRVKVAHLFYWSTIICHCNLWTCRSQWPRGLRRGSAAACLLGLWVRIPPGTWMSVCCECCVLSGRGLRYELSTRPGESYRVWRVWVWSWILDNEEALAHWGLLCHGKKKISEDIRVFVASCHECKKKLRRRRNRTVRSYLFTNLQYLITVECAEMGEIRQDVQGLSRQAGIVRWNNWATFNILMSSDSLSGSFAKLRQATVGFLVSVRPYAWNSSGPTGRIVMKIYIWLFFENVWRKSKMWLKSDKKSTFREDLCTFITVPRWAILKLRNVSDESCRENQNTHVVFNNLLFWGVGWGGGDLAIYGVIWKNMVELERPQVTV
jgi:hypothetical protein